MTTNQPQAFFFNDTATTESLEALRIWDGTPAPHQALVVMTRDHRERLVAQIREHYAPEVESGAVTLTWTGFDRGLLVGIDESEPQPNELGSHHLELLLGLARLEHVVIYDIERRGTMLVLHLQIRAA